MKIDKLTKTKDLKSTKINNKKNSNSYILDRGKYSVFKLKSII